MQAAYHSLTVPSWYLDKFKALKRMENGLRQVGMVNPSQCWPHAQTLKSGANTVCTTVN